MTDEQKALIAHAAEGHVLLTPAGSANDVLWGELADRGWMEPTELPKELAGIVTWHAWKMTDDGRNALREGMH